MSQFINQLLYYFLTNPFVIAFLTISLLVAIFNKQIIGWFGEHWTKSVLRKLPKDKYKVLNNILIKQNGYSNQIDHIVISKYGIFVIESKQYNGYITGNKYDKKWIRHYGKNYKVYYENPIRQNYGHVKAICSLLKLDTDKVFNIVCIPSKAELNIQHNGELTRYDTLREKILSYHEEIIPNPETCASIIVNNNIQDKDARKEHNVYASQIRKSNIDKCPKCGGELVRREGKYGEFIGCMNYPKCRYTEKI